MHISDVAKSTGLSARQIREYEKLGLLATIARTEASYRDFNAAQIKRLQFIKHARDVGFSLANIKALLALQDDQQRNNAVVKSLTRQHIDELTQKIESLQAMRTTLQLWHDSCLGDGSAECSILDSLMTGQTCSTHQAYTHQTPPRQSKL